jgi:hypothetical protein
VKIEITTLNAVVDHRWNAETNDTAPHVVLRFGEADIARWQITKDECDLMTNSYDAERELSNYVAGKLAALLGTSESR